MARKNLGLENIIKAIEYTTQTKLEGEITLQPARRCFAAGTGQGPDFGLGRGAYHLFIARSFHQFSLKAPRTPSCSCSQHLVKHQEQKSQQHPLRSSRRYFGLHLFLTALMISENNWKKPMSGWIRVVSNSSGNYAEGTDRSSLLRWPGSERSKRETPGISERWCPRSQTASLQGTGLQKVRSCVHLPCLEVWRSTANMETWTWCPPSSYSSFARVLLSFLGIYVASWPSMALWSRSQKVLKVSFGKLIGVISTARYAVSNPILASYYRDKLESVRGLKVGVDPSAFQPANCLDLLLRAIPYLTYEYVVGRLVVATDSRSILSQEDLPFEDLYSAAIINALQRLGYAADSSKSPSVGKVDIFVNDKQKFRLEGIMAKRGQKGNQTGHDEHRGRFDNPNQAAYSEADHKGLFTIGVVDDVRLRVVNTRAEGVEIIGLVPNIAHTGYHILYRGLEAKLLPHKLTIGSFYPWFCARKHSLHRVVVRFELLSPPHSAYHSERCTSCAGRSGGVQCWVRPCGAWVDRWANSLHPEVIAQ